MHTKNLSSLAQKILHGIILLAVFLLAFSAEKMPIVQAQQSIQTQTTAVVSLSADKASFGTTESVVLHVTITNPHDYSISILKWYTPVEKVDEPLFIVTRNGEPVAYIGKLIKRRTPTDQDYIVLAAGKSLTGDVKLSDYYDLSLSGNYAVTFNTALRGMYRTAGNKQSSTDAVSLTSNSLELYVAGRAISVPNKIQALPVNGSTTFNACSVSQQADLISARNAASTYASDAVAYFSANKQGVRYTTWFGVFDASRYSTVASHFSNISYAMDNANPMAFDCTCPNTNIYAYVYPNLPYTIYLCGAFWSAPTSGTDSKAGTLIHETSHFTVVAGTDDVVYGQTESRALALSNPASAITNADSHEYFAENNPPLEVTITYTITGNAGIAGATLTYTDGTPQFVTSDGSGNYSIAVSSGWSGTVTPYKIGYAFTPVNISYINVTSNQTGQNYTAQVCPACADRDTVGVFRPSDGALYLKNSNITGYADVAINYGLGGDYPITGDWDGNGTATIGIYRNGIFYLRNSNTIGFADMVFPFGAPGDQPVAGDWDNDGIDTIGVYRSSAITFYLRNSNTSGAPEMSFALGNPGDVGIAGDWNGDGFDTTGVFRPSNGALYLKNANTTGFADVQINYGQGGDQPVTGDWNGDGIDTIGIYRNGAFYLRNSNTIGFADIVFALGVPGDMPIGGNWDNLP